MILYLNTFSGISGNMMIAGLLDLGIVDQTYLEKELKKLNLEDYSLDITPVEKLGMGATYFQVLQDGQVVDEIQDQDHDHVHNHHYDDNHHSHDHNHERHHDHDHYHDHDHSHGHHEHRNLYDIEKIIDESSLSQEVKDRAKRIFGHLAKAESKIHRKDFKDLHFHEVGALDAIIDIVGVAILLEAIKPDHIYSSPVHVGTGYVKCAHGIMPVPAPATLEIIADNQIQIYQKGIEAELVTPTGAAILADIVEKYRPMPSMEISKIGYGAGKRDLEIPNILRLVLGQKKKPQPLYCK